MEAPLPRMLDARYRLDAVLGEGGMGVVYAGFDLTIQREVAVKLLKTNAGMSVEETRRLLREIQALGQVKSAHSVTLFDAGETPEGAPFLVMELVRGESLQEVLAREGSLAPARAVALALQACEALAAAHAAGLVHRDVKPGNIMLSPSPDGERLTLLDFGIAKHTAAATALTEDGALIGTLDYMAPEQIAGERLDGRADQYALAATIVRAVSGETLFPGAGLASVVHHHLMTVPTPLGDRVPSVPAWLDAALCRALEKKPALRYPDILAFAAALRREAAATKDGPAEASPSLTPSRSPSFGVPRELALDPAGDLVLAVDALPVPEPRPPSSFVPTLRERRPAVEAGAPPDPRREALVAWLAPAIWKRVVLYSGLFLVLGKGCFRGFSTTLTVLSVLALVVGAAALVAHAVLAKPPRPG